MSIVQEDKPFEDREAVKAKIRLCAIVGQILAICSLVFAVLGVIYDVVNITLGLESMSWFLLAIVCGINAIIPHMHSVMAKHLYGIEAERKKE